MHRVLDLAGPFYFFGQWLSLVANEMTNYHIMKLSILAMPNKRIHFIFLGNSSYLELVLSRFKRSVSTTMEGFLWPIFLAFSAHASGPVHTLQQVDKVVILFYP